MSLEFCGIGDLHLGKLNKVLDKVVDDVDELIANELRKPLNYAVKKGIPNAIYYGDVGDKPTLSYDSHLAFLTVVSDPKYKDIQHHIILGNHDFEENGRHSLELVEWFCNRLHGNLHVYTTQKVVKIGGINVNFLPYPFTKTQKDCLNVGHFEVAGSIRDNGRQISEGKHTNNLCVLGHLHTPHVVRNSHFSGTLFQTNFGESLPKGFHHARVKSVKEFQITQINNDPAFKLVNLEIYTRKDLAKISKDPMHLYKLFIKDAVDIDIEDLGNLPNVIKTNIFKNKEELNLILEEEWKENEEVTNLFQPEEDLRRFLSTRKVNPQVQKKVVELHEKFIKEFVNA